VSGPVSAPADALQEAMAQAAYLFASDPVQAQALFDQLNAPGINEADVTRDLGPDAAKAWRRVNAARLAFFRVCGVPQ
jgi:hypothetical protein